MHLFRSATDDKDFVAAPGTGSSDFGMEVEGKLVVTVLDGVRIDALYGAFLPGEAMRTVREIVAGVSLKTEHLFCLTVDVAF